MNPVVHFELPYENPEQTSQFYQAASWWHTQMPGDEMGRYVSATTAGSDAKAGAPAAAIDGGFHPGKFDWPLQ